MQKALRHAIGQISRGLRCKNIRLRTVFTLTSGPVDAYPAVLRALSRTVLYDYDPAFLACYERVNERPARLSAPGRRQ